MSSPLNNAPQDRNKDDEKRESSEEDLDTAVEADKEDYEIFRKSLDTKVNHLTAGEFKKIVKEVITENQPNKSKK